MQRRTRLKIVFFGTGEFSVTILNGLIEYGHEILAVVSQPDKINARNNKVVPSHIKQFCEEKGIQLFQFQKLNIEGEIHLKNLNAELFVTASYGQIIRQNILDIPKFDTINVHASLLPKYRGPAPIQWSIIHGNTTTGITIMRTELGLDTGAIYLQKDMPILGTDTASSVFQKMSTLGVVCLNEFFDNFDFYINNAIPQDESNATYYPMLNKEDSLLDFNMSAKDLVNLIRGREMTACCYFIYKGERYKIYFAEVSEMKGKASEILSANYKTGLIIGCKDKSIKIKIIQPAGKGKMDAENYMNSNKFTVGDMIENS